MKNRHVSSLPANAKSQRAALPSLLGALAGESNLFRGFGETTMLWVLEHGGGAPCPPPPQPWQWGGVWGVQGWARR